MYRILKSQQGSALLTVLVVILIAGMLGVALISLATVNYTSVQASADALKAKYSAESGLDEVYVVINKEIETTLDEIKTHEEEFIRARVEAAIEEDWSGDSDGIRLTDANGVVLEEEVSRYTQDEIFRPLFLNGSPAECGKEGVRGFLPGFMQYFPRTLDNSGMEREVPLSELNSNYGTGDILKQKITMRPINDGDTNIYMDVESNVSISQSSRTNALNKTIKLTFEIPIPQYEQMAEGGVDYSVVTYNQLKKNVLWTKALAAGKDLKVEAGGNLSVTGNLYVYGSGMTDESIGGVLVDGTMNVTGNIATGGYLLCSSPGASITVSRNTDPGYAADSEVFCNSIAIGKNSDGSRISITGNVNASDDIELNGRGLIRIDGNFYGFQNTDDKANMSSSILVNCDLEENTGVDEGIIITGDGPAKSYYVISSETGYESNGKGTYIAGTAYVGVTELEGLENDEINKYQTGESVAVRGNYLYYTDNNWISLPDVVVDTRHVDFSKNNVDFSLDDYTPALNLAVKINNIDGEADGINFKNSAGTSYKAAYLTKVAQEPLNKMLLGNGKINIGNVKYSLGAYIAEEAEKYVMKNDNGSMGLYLNFSDSFQTSKKEYNYQVNRMADPQITNFQAADTLLLERRMDFSERFNFARAAEEYGNFGITNGQIIYSGASRNEILVIRGENSSISDAEIQQKFPGCEIRDTRKELQGIIATKGSVYLLGDINYTGTIIAEGDIIIGPGRVNINNNYDNDNIRDNYVVNKVVGDNTLKDSFKAEGTQSYYYSYTKLNLNPGLYIDRNKVRAREWKVTR